jgi:hypothetical protein
VLHTPLELRNLCITCFKSAWLTCATHVSRVGSNFLLFGQPRSDHQSVLFMMRHKVWTKFDSIHDTPFFCLLSFSSWLDNNFDRRGHHSQVNTILGNLLQLHYLGVVVRGAGRTAPMTSWRDYAHAPDARYGNAQGAVRNAFWVSTYMFITSVTSCNT